MIPLSEMTENDVWSECCRMWTDVVEDWKEIKEDIPCLKNKWVVRNGYTGENRPKNECFFCNASNPGGGHAFCFRCPGKTVDPEFDCYDEDYHFEYRPVEFLAKIIEMGDLRKSK